MSDFDYGKTLPSGQHERYPSEVKPDYRQPLRDTYRHTVCGGRTTIHSDDIVRTYASNPHYYTHTFCAQCQGHFPLSEFVWLPDEIPMTKVVGKPGEDLRFAKDGRHIR